MKETQRNAPRANAGRDLTSIPSVENYQFSLSEYQEEKRKDFSESNLKIYFHIDKKKL
jgi:hypothetical protein